MKSWAEVASRPYVKLLFAAISRPVVAHFGTAKHLIFLCAMVALAQPASAMDLTIVDPGMPLQVKLAGEINSGDAARLIRALEKAKPKEMLAQLEERAPASDFDPRQWLWVDVESSGGDLDESLALGRYLREANALITTKQGCSNACVLRDRLYSEEPAARGSDGRDRSW